MKLLLTVLALGATLAHAAIPVVPNCSFSCFLTALTTDGCATIDDFACHCAQPQLGAQIFPCVAAACSADETANVTATVEQTCADAGVPIVVGGGNGTTNGTVPEATATTATATATGLRFMRR